MDIKMDRVSNVVVAIGTGAVAIVLLLGMINMLRGDNPDHVAKADALAGRTSVRRYRYHHGRIVVSRLTKH